MGAVGVLADHGDPVAVLDPRVDQHAPSRIVHACAVGAEDAGLRDRRQAAPYPDVEMVQRCGAKVDQDVIRPRFRIRSVLVAQNLRPAVLVDADGLHSARC
jgi:hypothetical protein